MQTFLPYPDFKESAQVLDWRRLGKQRIETRAIISAHFWPEYGWQRHPATRMWRGFTLALAQYGLEMCKEWKSRGYQDNTIHFFLEILEKNPTAPRTLPPWMGDPRLHRSHQSNLLRKNELHYSQFGWDVGPHLPYFWPCATAQNALQARRDR